MKNVVIQFPPHGLIVGFACVVEPVQRRQVLHNVIESNHIIWIESQRLLRLLHRRLVAPFYGIEKTEVDGWQVIPWIALFPFSICFSRLIQFSRDKRVVVRSDMQLLPLAGTIAQIECPSDIFICPVTLAEIAI